MNNTGEMAFSANMQLVSQMTPLHLAEEAKIELLKLKENT